MAPKLVAQRAKDAADLMLLATRLGLADATADQLETTTRPGLTFEGPPRDQACSTPAPSRTSVRVPRPMR